MMKRNQNDSTGQNQCCPESESVILFDHERESESQFSQTLSHLYNRVAAASTGGFAQLTLVIIASTIASSTTDTHFGLTFFNRSACFICVLSALIFYGLSDLSFVSVSRLSNLCNLVLVLSARV